MVEAFTSASQTAAIRAGMRPAGAQLAALGRLQGALTYLAGGGLHEVTTLTEAAHKRGAAQVTCDTDVMLALLILAADPLQALADAGKAEGAAHG